MKGLLGLACAAALVLAPSLGAAQGRGGHGGGHWGGGWHGGGYRGWGGYRGYYGYGGYYGGVGVGLALGAYAYGWPGYYGPSYYSYYDYGPPPVAVAPAAPAYACGVWNWLTDQSRYVWVPGPCPGPAA